MKVALIGDVHANLPALEAVLNDVREQGIDTLWNLGDFLGYGPYPNEVVDRLREAGAVSIIGNYDAKVLAFEQKRKKWRKTKIAEKYLAFSWAHEHLSDESRKYLASLPAERALTANAVRVLLTHGSPAFDSEHLGPETPIERFEQLAAAVDTEVVACGHSHQPFSKRVAGVWFINPGSVGRPEGGDARANWAIVHIAPEQIEVQHQHTEYDIDRAVRAIRKAALPEDFAQMLIQGRNLNEIRQEQQA